MVMMGGPSGEHEVSLASGRMVVQALNPDAYDVHALIIERSGAWILTRPEDLKALDPKPQNRTAVSFRTRDSLAGIGYLDEIDVVFLALHGTFGEDGTLQGMMETLGIPYTGSGPLASALAMHKQKAKQLLALRGLSVPSGIILTAHDVRHDLAGCVVTALDAVGLPAVVKPNKGGSSLGASLAENADELGQALLAAAQQDSNILIEEKLEGTEVTCAILEGVDGHAEALPLVEIKPRHGEFFDFQSKYETGGSDEIVPARIPPEATRQCQEAAVTAHRELGCEAFSRVDMFWTNRGPVVLEVNTIPGMTPNSLLPKAAKAAGILFPDLITRLVELAVVRHQRQQSFE